MGNILFKSLHGRLVHSWLNPYLPRTSNLCIQNLVLGHQTPGTGHRGLQSFTAWSNTVMADDTLVSYSNTITYGNKMVLLWRVLKSLYILWTPNGGINTLKISPLLQKIKLKSQSLWTCWSIFICNGSGTVSKGKVLFSKRSAHENHPKFLRSLGRRPQPRVFLPSRPFGKIHMTLGQHQWPNVTGRTGRKWCTLLLKKNV